MPLGGGVIRKLSFSAWSAALLCAFLAVLFLFCSKTLATGVLAGFQSCYAILIPALFPFMILASFVASSDVSVLLARLLSPVTRHVFGLEPSLGVIVLMSFLGGYPVGAKLIADRLRAGEISEKTASRMLCFCVNAGPSFLISAVGAGLLGSLKAGVLLLAAQILASVTIALVLKSKRTAELSHTRAPAPLPYPEAFVKAVSGSADAMLKICAFVLFFSGLVPLIDLFHLDERVNALLSAVPFLSIVLPEGLIRVLFSGIFEVTTGCIQAAALPGVAPVLIPLFVSFGGLSIISQVAVSFEGLAIDLCPFYRSRIAAALLTFLYFYPVYRLWPMVQPVFAPGIQPLPTLHGNSWLLTVSLMGMSCILLLSFRRQEQSAGNGKKKR